MLALSTASAEAHQPLSMRVSPTQSFAPATVTVRVHVESADDNRGLEVVAESDEFYRASSAELDGSDAPSTITFEFRDVPGGSFEIKATLIGSAGKSRAVIRQHINLIDPATDGATP